MCSRRNPDDHPRLIGKFSTLDRRVATWTGVYPRGLSEEDVLVAERIRRKIEKEGKSKPDVVEALESRFSDQMHMTSDYYAKNPAYGGQPTFSDLAKSDLFGKVARNWQDIKWIGERYLVETNFHLGESRYIDFVGFDVVKKAVAVVQVQDDQEPELVVYEAATNRDVMKGPFQRAGYGIEATALVWKATKQSIELAKEAKVRLYSVRVEAIWHLSTKDTRSLDIKLKREL